MVSLAVYIFLLNPCQVLLSLLEPPLHLGHPFSLKARQRTSGKSLLLVLTILPQSCLWASGWYRALRHFLQARKVFLTCKFRQPRTTVITLLSSKWSSGMPKPPWEQGDQGKPSQDPPRQEHGWAAAVSDHQSHDPWMTANNGHHQHLANPKEVKPHPTAPCVRHPPMLAALDVRSQPRQLDQDLHQVLLSTGKWYG